MISAYLSSATLCALSIGGRLPPRSEGSVSGLHNSSVQSCYHIWTRKPVLWIRGILVRIRISGSVSLTNGSGSYFFKDFRFSADYFLKVHYYHFSKIKSH
jgi:hypothetical protein